MKEFIDLRISLLGKPYAEKYLSMFGTSNLLIETANPEYKLLREFILTYKPSYNFIGFKRSYTKKEINEAKFFSLPRIWTLWQASDTYGTEYDFSDICKAELKRKKFKIVETANGRHEISYYKNQFDICGIGRKQVSDMIFDLRVIHRNKDIMMSATGEYIVSERLVNLFRENNLKGAEFYLIKHFKKSKKKLDNFYQMIIKGTVGKSQPPTQFGRSPFTTPDENNEDVCPLGHISGLEILSELYIDDSHWDGSDIAKTEDYIGDFWGHHVPSPLVVLSRKFYNLILIEKLKGFRLEVTHTV